jgi:hypothetical protein
VAFLRALFEREPTPRGRALLAGTESCLLGALHPDDSQEARQRAIVGVQAEPSNPEGGTCNPWEQLMSLEREATASDGAIRAMQAWLPWNAYAWFEPGYRADGRDPAALPLLWRAYRLSPLDSQIASTLGRALLASGDRAATRGIAADLRKGGLPLHALASDMLLTQVEASEARFGPALQRARHASAISSADVGWVRVQRFEAGWHAFELAVLLEREREVADELIERFVDPDPTLLDPTFPSVPIRVPALSTGPSHCGCRPKRSDTCSATRGPATCANCAT